MRLINPTIEILQQSNNSDGYLKHIELIGRTCYKSEDKITDTSYKEFVGRMINSKHYAMLEHGTVYLNLIPQNVGSTECDFIEEFMYNPYSECVRVMHDNVMYAVTTNLRVLVENNLMDSLKYECIPTEFHKKRYSVKFITDRGVSHELVRHRVFSFAQESQRYCNYTKDKYGNEITFIKPSWYDKDPYTRQASVFHLHCSDSEFAYRNLIDKGLKPQDARCVLPNATKTEIVMTGFDHQWESFFDLRFRGTTGKPHPEMLRIATMAHEAFIEKYNLVL